MIEVGNTRTRKHILKFGKQITIITHYLVSVRNQDFRKWNVTYCEKVSERCNSWVNINQLNRRKPENLHLPQGEKLHITYSIDRAEKK